MILLRDFLLFALPVLIAAGGWLYAFSLRKRAQLERTRRTRAGGMSMDETFSAP